MNELRAKNMEEAIRAGIQIGHSGAIVGALDAMDRLLMEVGDKVDIKTVVAVLYGVAADFKNGKIDVLPKAEIDEDQYNRGENPLH